MNYKWIEDTLKEEYPTINTGEHIWSELINTGCEYGAGWHHLIIELITKIEEIYKKQNADITEFKISQIKEKYGELRFYASSQILEVHDLILEYEEKSCIVCEECGAVGSLYEQNNWLQTLCEKCANAKGYTKVE